MQQSPKNPIKPIVIALGSGILIIIVISILALNGVFHSNPYGPEQKIANFSRYFQGIPTPTRDMLFTGLYNIAALNLEDQAPYPPDVKATIRDNTASSNYNENTNIHTNDFIVDVSVINQSFKVWFEWSSDANNPNLSGYQVSITCTSPEDSLYGSSNCKDNSSVNNPVENLYDTHPLLSHLPLDVAFYQNTYSGYVHYTVTFETIPDLEDKNKQTVELVITDYTGGNYDRAISKLKSLDANLDKYSIRYVDESADYIPSRAPNDAL